MNKAGTGGHGGWHGQPLRRHEADRPGGAERSGDRGLFPLRARRAGFETVIFVIKHEIEDAFKAAIGERVSKAMNVKYAFQQLDELPAGFAVPEGRVKPWGTCHAVLAAKDLIEPGPV